MRQFDTGATRDDAEGKPDYRGFLSPLVLRRFGEYMLRHQVQSDGQLRASDNWKKGIPQEAYLSSLLRHVVDLWRAIEDPYSDTGDVALNDLLCAVLFNAQGLLHERLVGGSHGQADAKLNPDIDMNFKRQSLLRTSGANS